MKTDAASASVPVTPASADDLVTVQRESEPEPGEAIPPRQVEPAITTTIRLDRGAIASIREDTRVVAAMLARAMSDDLDPDAAEPGNTTAVMRFASKSAVSSVSNNKLDTPLGAAAVARPPARVIADPTLPARYVALVQSLIVQDQWPLSEAKALARDHGLMLGGAIETVNEWSVEHFGKELFFQSEDRILVEKQYVERGQQL